MTQRLKSASQLEADVGPMDLLVLVLPATINDKKPVHGTDYATGFFVGVHRVGEQPFVTLTSVQKNAYDQPKPERYPFASIKGYEVLRRFTPDSHNPIDARVIEALGLGERYRNTK